MYKSEKDWTLVLFETLLDLLAIVKNDTGEAVPTSSGLPSQML